MVSTKFNRLELVKVLKTQWSLLTIAFFLLLLVSSKLDGYRSVKERFIAPPPLLEHHSVGMRYQLSNIMWIRSLQDFDYCESEIAKNTCRGQSWLFKMLETVTSLDSRFRPAYYYGSLALTILISDYDGATKLLDRGVEQYSKDWQLNYLAGYHALFEEKNNEKAAHAFKRAAENGAPAWLYSRASTLYTEAGRKDLAILLLENLKNTNTDPKIIERMEKRINVNENSK